MLFGRWQGLEKVKSFMSLLLKEKLPTNTNRAGKHLLDGNRCPRCLQVVETNIHTIQDYPKVSDVWLRIVHPQH